MYNRSSGFLLIEFHQSRASQITFFSLLLLTYCTTLTGNFLIIILTWRSHHLHNPMYFFLVNLSFLEIWITTTITPKFLSILANGNRTISFWSCLVQCYIYFVLGSVEFITLTMMSFDRYIAVCYPLRYKSIMNSQLCLYLIIGSWIGGIISTLPQSFILPFLSFCGPNQLDHFFCDIEPLLKLVCADKRLINLLNLLISSVTVLGSLIVITTSYIFIIRAVFKIPTGGDRWKSFSTCISHILLVCIFYSGSVFMCLRFIKNSSVDFNKLAVILNTIITPLMNPFIYTLRNSQRDFVSPGYHWFSGDKLLLPFIDRDFVSPGYHWFSGDKLLLPFIDIHLYVALYLRYVWNPYAI
ncbi:olfactory receptor 6M1-like [Pelobates fuscus]|uniref:olfactory receptor 6M1-like n=1 Tax=Pelobates fuscus TaxID=191477 RepID=UPI002FE4A439